MLLWILVVCLTVAVRQSLGFTANEIICRRLPNNPNCPGGGQVQPQPQTPPPEVSSSGPVVPPQPQLPPQPIQPQLSPPQVPPVPQAPQAPQAPESPPPFSQDLYQACQSLRQPYETHCTTGAALPPDEQSYCDLFVERCTGGGGQPIGAQRAAGLAPYRQKPPFGSKWLQLTRRAEQKEQVQQVESTEKWLYDCGSYALPYNTLCYPNASNFFCNNLRHVCQTHAEDLAAGQTPVNGPFAYNNGLPTGGAGSSRPLSWGNNIGIGPFFNLGANKALNPLQGYGQAAQIQVPIVGLGATISKGVDYGGLIGITQLGQLLDGKRRRRMTTKLKTTVMERWNGERIERNTMRSGQPRAAPSGVGRW